MKAPISILLDDDQTTGFIETDLQLSKEMPELYKKYYHSLYLMSDVVLTTISFQLKTMRM